MLAAPGDRLEVPVGRFVIDLIRADGELVEVQTGGFGPLGAKLDALLDRHRFRIVHPVAAKRRIVRVDEHGEVLSIRRSPKCATVVEVFDKLTAFPSLLTHPNLTVEVLLVGEDHVRAADPAATNARPRSAAPSRSARPDRAPRRRRRDACASAASGAAIQHPRVGFPPRMQHAARAADCLLPAGDQHHRSGRETRPYTAAPADSSRGASDLAHCPLTARIRRSPFERRALGCLTRRKCRCSTWQSTRPTPSRARSVTGPLRRSEPGSSGVFVCGLRRFTPGDGGPCRVVPG